MLADRFDIPYYAVIFTTVLSEDTSGYEAMAFHMEIEAMKAGCLGFDSARSAIGITVSYWKDLNSINIWKQNLDHIQAKELGKSKWYSEYRLRISKVEIEY